VDIHPGGRWAVSGNDDGTLATWDMATGSRRASLEAHSDRVTALVFAADGRQFLSASLDGSARLWDASRTRTEGVIECPCGIASADLSPDGSFAVLGGVDGSVQIWHLPRNERLREFRSHGQEVRSLRFSRDGHFAASASPDKSVIVWELDWDYEFPEISEDVASARPFITNLLLRRTDLPSGTEAAAIWTEDDFQTLMDEMCLCGLGWMDFDAVRAELERMAEEMRA
jgi:WD40 repeat protein